MPSFVNSSLCLHYFVFKQLAGHLPHEANTEQTFSTGGVLSDPHMCPTHLGRLVYLSLRKNYHLYEHNISNKQ